MRSGINLAIEGDIAGWTPRGPDLATMTATYDTTVVDSDGGGSMKIVETAAGSDNYMGQDIDNIGLGLDAGGVFRVRARVNVTDFQAGANLNRGLVCVSEQVNAVYTQTITAATAGFVTLELVMKLPATDVGIEIRLCAFQGTGYWSSVELAQLSREDKIALATSGPF